MHKTFATQRMAKAQAPYLKLIFLLAIVIAVLSNGEAWAAGPSVSDIEERLESRYRDLNINRVRVSNRSKQQGLMGEIHDGLFTATASLNEPLYAVVSASNSGTIIKQTGSPGSKVSIQGGFAAMRDAGIWEVELRRVKVSPSLGKPLGVITSYSRKPVAVAGTEEALNIRNSEDRRLIEQRDREIAEQKEVRRRKAEKERRAREREAIRLQKEQERKEKAALEASYEAWEDEMADQLVGVWSGRLLTGVPAQPFYSDSNDNKYPECHGYLDIRLAVPSDGYNDFHRFINVSIESNFLPDQSGHIMVNRRTSVAMSRTEYGTDLIVGSTLRLDGEKKTIKLRLPRTSFICELKGTKQRGNVNFFTRKQTMIDGIVVGDKITFKPQPNVMKDGKLDYTQYSAVLERESSTVN